MPEWLQQSFQSEVHLDFTVVASRLVVALVLGCVVAGVCRLTRGRMDEQSLSLMATLALLTVIICMVALAIGDNIARAFSLVGALAIVRFRTVVEDTRDTAFVIFAVAVGLAAGAGFMMVPLVGIPIVALASFIFRPRQLSTATPLDAVLTVRLGIGYRPDILLRELFDKYLERSRLTTTATARQGAAMDYTFNIRMRREEDAPAFVAELNKIEGMQSVELRQGSTT